MPDPSLVRQSPLWFPHQVNVVDDRVLMVERGEEDFRAAAFLDDRSLPAAAPREIVTWTDLERAMAPDDRRDAHYIFHIGHVGSTLISRLLGEMPGLFALREPLLLRTFFDLRRLQGTSHGPWPAERIDRRLDTLAALMSRTFRPGQRALVKATSFTSEIATDLVQPGARALLLDATADHYLENILAGEASRQELQMLAPSRAERLNRRLGRPHWNADAMSEAEKAALGWACEMLALGEAEARLPAGDSLRMDFDLFLERPAERLAEIAAFFGCPLEPSAARALTEGPLMRRYSKALEYAYSPSLRRDVLAQSRRENRAALLAARSWLDQAAKIHPALADRLGRRD